MIAIDVVFALERLTPSLRGEIEPLLREHWAEVAHYKDIPLDPDWEAYDRMQRAGILRIFTARDCDGQLIGYTVYFVMPNPHYKTTLHANQDLIFIEPSHRKGGLGMAIIRFADENLAAEGVVVVTQHVKAAHNFGPMLERMGYTLMDLIFARRLD